MSEKIKRQITEAFKVVQKYNNGAPQNIRKKTAITLFYNNDGVRKCWEMADYEIRAWAKSYIDPEVRANVDYVLLSYYENEGDCPELDQEPQTFIDNFKVLSAADMFPKARMGLGEVGYRMKCPKDSKERPDNKNCIAGDPRCPAEKRCIGQASYIRKYYQTLNGKIVAGLPNYFGGYFYWYFNSDMTGQNKAGDRSNQERNRSILKEAMKRR